MRKCRARFGKRTELGKILEPPWSLRAGTVNVGKSCLLNGIRPIPSDRSGCSAQPFTSRGGSNVEPALKARPLTISWLSHCLLFRKSSDRLGLAAREGAAHPKMSAAARAAERDFNA